MRRKGRYSRRDPLRKLVRGMLNVLLGALATYLAGRITDWILGPAEQEDAS